MIREWFHHFFNPHCQHCEDLKQDSSICQSCEVLKKELDLAHNENSRLLDALLKRNAPVVVNTELEETKPLKPRHMPWSAMRQQLEERERIRAMQIRAEKEKELFTIKTEPVQIRDEIVDTKISDLERELGVEDAG